MEIYKPKIYPRPLVACDRTSSSGPGKSCSESTGNYDLAESAARKFRGRNQGRKRVGLHPGQRGSVMGVNPWSINLGQGSRTRRSLAPFPGHSRTRGTLGEHSGNTRGMSPGVTRVDRGKVISRKPLQRCEHVPSLAVYFERNRNRRGKIGRRNGPSKTLRRRAPIFLEFPFHFSGPSNSRLAGSRPTPERVALASATFQ